MQFFITILPIKREELWLGFELRPFSILYLSSIFGKIFDVMVSMTHDVPACSFEFNLFEFYFYLTKLTSILNFVLNIFVIFSEKYVDEKRLRKYVKDIII